MEGLDVRVWSGGVGSSRILKKGEADALILYYFNFALFLSKKSQ